LETQSKRRDRLNIIAEILSLAKDGRLKTQIMYRANLSFAQLNEYLDFLIKTDFLNVQNESRKITYKTTNKGDLYLEKYKAISNLLETDEKNI
jgi:predicted transcriptional regulator